MDKATRDAICNIQSEIAGIKRAIHNPAVPYGEPKKNSTFTQWLLRWKPVIEVIGLLVVIAYTVIAGLQWGSIIESNRIAKEANRPYVGVNGIVAVFSGMQDGKAFQINSPTDKTNQMSFRIELKNFGASPASNTTFKWHVFVGNIEMPSQIRMPDTPITSFPGLLCL